MMPDELEYARRILGLTCCRYNYAEFADRYVADAELADFGVNAECLETSVANILREYREAVLATIPQVKDTVDHSENCCVTKQPWTS